MPAPLPPAGASSSSSSSVEVSIRDCNTAASDALGIWAEERGTPAAEEEEEEEGCREAGGVDTERGIGEPIGGYEGVGMLEIIKLLLDWLLIMLLLLLGMVVEEEGTGESAVGPEPDKAASCC